MKQTCNEDDWIEDICIGECGNGFFARIDGTDVMSVFNEYNTKERISLTIVEKAKSRKAAIQKALTWLKRNIKTLENEDANGH